MKKLIIIAILTLLTSFSGFARGNLNIDTFFCKETISQPGVSLISYNDWQIKGHKVKEYKSVTIAGNKALANRLRNAVTKDGANAESKQTSYKDGELYFGFYSLGGSGKNRKYILYLNRRPAGEEKSTLIYLEGDVDTGLVREMLKLK